jgi:hypothetical protein
VPLTISSATADGGGIRARLQAAGHDEAVSVRSRECDPALGDALVCLCLLSAMRAGGGQIEIPAPVAEELLARVPLLVEVFRQWIGPPGARITVDAAGATPRSPRPRTAAFFSGGVDSFATVFRHVNELDELIFVRGFDIPIGGPLDGQATRSAQAVSTELGIPLVEVETDLRSFIDPLVIWPFAHGSLLAAVAHAVGRAGTVLVASTLDFRQQEPWGSNPVTDPWWSSDAVRIVPDGMELTRLEKFALIAQNDVALRHLRVCYENGPDGPLNCGRCSKCLNAILSLHLVGALERCATLPHTLDPDAWAALRPMPITEILRWGSRGDFKVSNARDLLECASGDATVPPAITAQLRRLLSPFDRLEREEGLLERLFARPAGYRLADKASRTLERYPRVRHTATRVVRRLMSWLERND